MAALKRFPATAIIIALTVAVTLLVSFLRYDVDAAILGGFIPIRIFGEDFGPDVTAVPAWLTPLSATLLHAGFFHLAMNMLMLLVTAQPTEKALGSRGLVILYVVGAYAAALSQWATDPESMRPMIGASGAASAVVGAYSLLFGRSRAKPIGPLSAQTVHVLWLAAAWTGINLLSAVAFLGMGIAIAAAAHIGGFVAGLLLAKPLLMLRWRGA